MSRLDTLPSTRTRRLVVIAGLTLAAAILAVAIGVYLNNPSGNDLPAAIQRVEPAPGTNVLAQSDIVVDLAAGYVGEIDVNGIPVPEDQLSTAAALNQFRFSPGEGKVIERLFADQNCVRVHYWLLAKGDDDRRTYTWCFDAS